MAESELLEILTDKSIESEKQLQGKSPYIEYWEFLLMLGFGSLKNTRQFYSNLRNKIQPTDWRMPLLEIGEARYLTLAGREFESYSRLQKVQKVIFSSSNKYTEFYTSEVLSLFSYVLTALQEKMSAHGDTETLLSSGMNLTSITNFKLAFEYRLLIHQVRHNNHPISDLLPIMDRLLQKKLFVLSCVGYRMMGIVYRIRKDYKSAHYQYNLGISLAKGCSLPLNLKYTQMAKGYCYFSEGELELAEELYSKICFDSILDHLRPILYENQALIAERRQQMDLAVSLVEDALKISLELDMVSLVPGEYLFLGSTFENHYKDLEQAEHYYKMGYDHAMRYASHGISLTGDRKDVVNAYVNLMAKKERSTIQPPKVTRLDPFAFAQGKSWREIKDIFHHQLVSFHAKSIKTSKLMAKKLDMPPSTLYSLQDRLKGKGFTLNEVSSSTEISPHDLNPFFEEHQNLSWDEINRIFEREMIHYLYERYGYNKHRMAKILDISYPSIIKKTRELTQVSDHLLQN